MLYLFKLTISLLLLFSQSTYAQANTVNNQVKEQEVSSSNLDKEPTCAIQEPSLNSGFIQNLINFTTSTFQNIKDQVSSLFSKAGSIWMRFFAAFLLGLLLSLTPCIYPMIPITVGILQINQSSSAVRSFLIAASYTLGISLTFAIFGFIASIGGCIFGELQGSPWTIVPLAFLLIYFGLSMLDFYEIKIPRFLQPKSVGVKQGSFLSAFIFGSVSGTVASPCLSPGLLLILNYVSSLSSSSGILGYLEGFLLLFVFGIGSSLPLLIIGTFSSSSKLMPRAGLWMVEIKKLIGIMLIGMAFYHLSHLGKILSWPILVVIISISFIMLGIYYILDVKSYDSSNIKIYKRAIGTLLILGSVIFGINSYKSIKNSKTVQDIENIWLNDFDQAVEKAKQENKLIFIDLGSSYCGACKSIDSTIFVNPSVIKALKDQYISLKINYDIEEESFSKIKQLYGPIKGFPTYIIANYNNQLIKKMGAELGDLTIEQVIELLIKSK